jgi:hypothetical protein
LFLRVEPHDHNLALIEVDFEARHGLEAKEEELEVDKIKFLPLHHDHSMVCILEVGNPTSRNVMSYHTRDVAENLSLL